MPRRRPDPVPPNGTSASASEGPSAPPQPPSDWVRGVRDMLIPYVLLAVSVQRAHGYVIEEYLRGLGFLGLEMSTLYRTLRQLEKEGLLASGWEPGPSGPARRVYSLTDTGRAWLDTWAGALVGYRELIDRFFGLYASPQAPPSRSRRRNSAQ